MSLPSAIGGSNLVVTLFEVSELIPQGVVTLKLSTLEKTRYIALHAKLFCLCFQRQLSIATTNYSK